MDETLPPEMLPEVSGEVWVCCCDGKNEPPCAMCWCAFDGEREIPKPSCQ